MTFNIGHINTSTILATLLVTPLTYPRVNIAEILRGEQAQSFSPIFRDYGTNTVSGSALPHYPSGLEYNHDEDNLDNNFPHAAAAA